MSGSTDTVPVDAALLDAALERFIRARDVDADPADRQALAEWAAADPAHEAALARVEAMWGADAFAAALVRTMQPVMSGAARRPRRRAWPLALAASVLLMIGIGAALDLPLRLRADAITATGERRLVVLADGSRVTLDTDSAIAVTIDETGRHLTLLEGRAFFEVTPDAARPFEVAAGPAKVRVTGTAFAVGFSDDDAVMVQVRSGRVEAGAAGSSRALGAGDALRLDGAGPGIVTRPDPAQGLGWLDGRLVFVDRPLGDVLAELDRYLPGRILVTDPAIAARRVTGNYRLDDPAGSTLALAAVAGAHVTQITGRLLILHQ
ncbi:FecR family protein [Tistrella mobilis]|uniref:FecR n=1 Tax=Tistrella mobilis (strain KA081020-065) TaxID=1110502 RepID=I3TJE3_TISMK|nr:FecR domain-containing protein [Tistrella mobilis]AFK52881.1 putative FecR [Tistrella mobilis KA081020-065]